VPSPPRPSDAPSGVTLLELLVVVLLLGLGAALTAPALLRARPAPTGADAARVTAFARGAAVRRGETLALDLAADGRWTLRVAHGDSLPLAAGALDATRTTTAMPRRLLVTPLGACLPDDDAADGPSPPSWDAGACRP
jgi:prepilin-type N-terminal cleavage/methylation domain-containing protein